MRRSNPRQPRFLAEVEDVSHRRKYAAYVQRLDFEARDESIDALLGLGFPRLWTIGFDEWKWTDDHGNDHEANIFPWFGPKIRKVMFEGLYGDKRVLDALKTCPDLRELCLFRPDFAVTPKEFSTFLDAFPNLEKLGIGRSGAASPEILGRLLRKPCLIHLDLYHAFTLSRVDVEQASVWPGAFSTFRSLELSVNDDALPRLVTCCRSLMSLELDIPIASVGAQLSTVTNAVVRLSNLRQLHLRPRLLGDDNIGLARYINMDSLAQLGQLQHLTTFSFVALQDSRALPQFRVRAEKLHQLTGRWRQLRTFEFGTLGEDCSMCTRCLAVLARDCPELRELRLSASIPARDFADMVFRTGPPLFPHLDAFELHDCGNASGQLGSQAARGILKQMPQLADFGFDIDISVGGAVPKFVAHVRRMIRERQQASPSVKE